MSMRGLQDAWHGESLEDNFRTLVDGRRYLKPWVGMWESMGAYVEWKCSMRAWETLTINKKEFLYLWRFHSLILGYTLLIPSPDQVWWYILLIPAEADGWICEFQDSLGYIRKLSWKTTKPQSWKKAPIADLIKVFHCVWQNALRVGTSTAGFCFRTWVCKPVEWTIVNEEQYQPQILERWNYGCPLRPVH